MPNSVKYFNSTMSGAPSLSGTAGALIGVLDACLVDGFGSVTVDSLVVASNVATATVSAGHPFAMIGNTGPVIRIAGASPSGLNGDWRVTVTSSTVFTFATSGISDQTATGTITAKRAPAGFSKAFSGTNKAAYRSDDITGTRLYCRIDDTGTTYARVRGYETMSDIDTGTGPFPTDAQLSGGGYIIKAASGTAAWNLYADTRTIILCIDNNTWQSSLFFGDINSYINPDAYCCALMAHTSTSITTSQIQTLSGAGGYLARSYSQTGTAITLNKYSHQKSTGIGDATSVSYPIPGIGALIWPVEIWEEATQPRGQLPGIWNPIHDDVNLPHGTVISDIPQLPQRDFIAQTVRAGKLLIDITGPWR